LLESTGPRAALLVCAAAAAAAALVGGMAERRVRADLMR
jgi:hypothetical protein